MYTNITTNLMVENVNVSLAFYCDILGFKADLTLPDEQGKLQFAILTKDGLTIMMQDRENLISECPSLKTDRIQPSITLYIMVDNFEQLYQDIKQKHQILIDLHETFYGAKEFAISDVDGYVLTFTPQKTI